MTSLHETNTRYVIYSANESAVTESEDDHGYWSAVHGWDKRENATIFSKEEVSRTALPICLGNDARVVPFRGH